MDYLEKKEILMRKKYMLKWHDKKTKKEKR